MREEIELEQMRRMPLYVICVLIGTLAVSFAGKPSIRLATVGRGRRPPKGCITTMCQTLRGGWERVVERWS